MYVLYEAQLKNRFADVAFRVKIIIKRINFVKDFVLETSRLSMNSFAHVLFKVHSILI